MVETAGSNAGYGSDPKMDIYRKLLSWLENGNDNVTYRSISGDKKNEEEEMLKKQEEARRIQPIFGRLN